jgi:hypothetical protein
MDRNKIASKERIFIQLESNDVLEMDRKMPI